jgi:uncharacterized cupin superfamily protein
LHPEVIKRQGEVNHALSERPVYFWHSRGKNRNRIADGILRAIGNLAGLANPSQLEDWGPVAEPEGERIGRVRGREQVSVVGGAFRIGVWECSPGRWRRQVMEREFAHFLAGRARFIPDQGEPFDINSDDAVWFSANTTGTWDITETLRKTYVIVAPRGAMRKLYGRLRRANSHQG